VKPTNIGGNFHIKLYAVSQQYTHICCVSASALKILKIPGSIRGWNQDSTCQDQDSKPQDQHIENVLRLVSRGGVLWLIVRLMSAQ